MADVILPFLTSRFGNPSAPYVLGRDAFDAVEQSRRQTALLLGCAPKQLVFTSGGTEANNLALKGAFFSGAAAGRRHLVISAVEHPSVLATCEWLRQQHGADLTQVPVDSTGRVDPEQVAAAFRSDTLLVSVMHANNETGTLQPVGAIAELARRHGVLSHVDGVQAAGRVAVDVSAIGCDLYSVSAHKFGGMKGAGALYVRDASGLEWAQQGGRQEHGLRAGTENVPGIVALGKAAEVALRDLDANRAACLRTRAVFDDLARKIPMTRMNGHPTERLPNTTNLCCLYADAFSVVLALSVQGVCVGLGSACASHAQEPSRVLRAMGLSNVAALCSIRVSTGPTTSLQDAEFVAHLLQETVERVRLVTSPEQIGVCDDDCPCFTGGTIGVE